MASFEEGVGAMDTARGRISLSAMDTASGRIRFRGISTQTPEHWYLQIPDIHSVSGTTGLYPYCRRNEIVGASRRRVGRKKTTHNIFAQVSTWSSCVCDKLRRRLAAAF